ncbi:MULTISPECIES: type IV pilin-like G/H family protein [unclassified Microcoleus]|uniref:type IV pilin-like G/H family protein n=1 Tax=unclassified Microcoleus TaxID=2642155 RepID=UPI002FCEDA3B
MTPPQKRPELSPLKRVFISPGWIVVLAIACFAFWRARNPETSSNSTFVATGNQSVAKQLIGQWQTQTPGDSVTLIFTDRGTLFVWNTPTVAKQMEYQTDVNHLPKTLDILTGGQVTGRTIFEFTADGKLRLILNNIRASRPTSFDSNARLFRKVSEQTTLPENVKVINFKEPSQARQSEVKQYVSSMNRGQQAFYAENARFTSILQELGLGIKSETAGYSYSIVLSNDRRFVQSIGLAKRDGLKGYTGIVFLVDSTNGKSTSSLFCESNQPSKELPGTPVFSNSTSNLQCPLGYSQIN